MLDPPPATHHPPLTTHPPGDLADLSHLVTLKILNLAGNRSIKGALGSLSRLNLEYLGLRGGASTFKSTQITGDLSDLINHTSLQTLNFGGDDDSRHRNIYGDVSCLGALSKLKHVDLTYCPGIDNGACVGKVPWTALTQIRTTRPANSPPHSTDSDYCCVGRPPE